jgi:hypothetical protein
VAYLDDDFQGYSIGQTLPFGSFVSQGVFTAQIQSASGGTGIPGTDRAFFVFGTAAYVHSSYLTQFTQWLALRLDSEVSAGGYSYAATNGPNGANQLNVIFSLKIEIDSTISIYSGAGALLGNSGDVLFPFRKWNFFQINATLSDVLVAGVNKVHILLELVLNGKSIISFNTTTTITSSNLKNGTAEANNFQLTGGLYGAFTLDVLTAAVNYPHPGSPKARVNQGAIEMANLPDSGKIQVHQGVVEITNLPDSGKIRINQGVIELIIDAPRWYISES